MVYQNGKMHSIMPNQEVDVDINPYPGLLVQVDVKPIEEDPVEEKLPEEIPEDLIVIVSDAIVEELKQEHNKKSRRKRRTKK